MARQRGSLPVEFHPTSRDGQFLSEEEYLRRRDITTKEQVAKLQQSAEYQAWAAARGRGQRQGRQYLATGSLVLAALAVIALTGLWRSMPDIQQAHIPSILRSSLLAISSPGWDLNQEVLTHYGEELEATPLLSESDLRGHLERRGSEISAKASIQGPEASEKQFSDAPQRPSTSIQEQGMHEKQLGSGEVSKLRSQIEMLQQVAEKMEGSLRDQHNQVLTLEQELANRDKTILSLRDQLQDMEDKAESLRQNYEFLLAHNTTTVATNADAAPTGRLVEAPAIAANISAMKSEVVRSETMNSADTLPSLPSNQQSLELMVLLFLISWLGLVWMYWRARQAHNKLRVADHKKVQDAQRLMAEWKEKHEQLTVQAAKIMQERNELLHKGEEMKNHGVQMQKPASEQSALDGKNVTAMVVENEHLRDQVAKKELDVLKGGLQLKKALESLNKVEQQLAKLREVCCEDDRNLRLRFLDELESNLKDFRIPTPDVRREVPASSIVRTGPAGTRKALVSLPVKDENEARQLEVRPSEAECHTLRSQLLEANKSLQEATIREAAITKETNKGVQALHDQVKALQKKNEELEHELQKRKAREERDVVLSPAAGARRLQGRASHGHGPIERELFPCDQADELDFDASSASPEDLQQRFQHYCNQYMGARMTILSLREELNNLRAVALKREDAGSLPSNDTVDDAGFREAPEALGLPVRDAPQECNREAHLTASEDDPQVLRARVAQMTADIAQIISYPGAELEMERLQRQVDAMEAELTERQADTRVAYDALQRKEEEVARLQAEIVSVTSKLEEVQNELESVKDELKVLDTSAAFAKRDLEHLKEENVLLQAQVDQVTASLLETREAKQDSEQQLQQVKQDSDDFAAMVGHYKQEIAMLEAQVKHLRDVHHEAALKLSIEGAEIEALGEQDKNQNRESLDTASQRRERVPVAALRRLMNRIEHVVELLGGVGLQHF
eukprot:jgi/Botrbrau1/21012/Bobra.0144s0027.2